jgi:hypothetical protein
MRRFVGVALVFSVGCTEYSVQDGPPTPVADPPPQEAGTHGDPPDWMSCTPAWRGRYYNLAEDHPDVAAAPEWSPGADPAGLDWWDGERFVFARTDPGLDMGAGWYPVDEGHPTDPAFFAAKWVAWLRVERRGEQQLVFGAGSDLWVDAGDERLVAVEAAAGLEPESVALDLPPGQYPLTVWFAHRQGASGLRLRFTGERFAVCPPRTGD